MKPGDQVQALDEHLLFINEESYHNKGRLKAGALLVLLRPSSQDLRQWWVLSSLGVGVTFVIGQKNHASE